MDGYIIDLQQKLPKTGLELRPRFDNFCYKDQLIQILIPSSFQDDSFFYQKCQSGNWSDNNDDAKTFETSIDP